jgi:hypothetical protein
LTTLEPAIQRLDNFDVPDEKQISFREGNTKAKTRSRFPSGMTTRKAKAKTEAKQKQILRLRRRMTTKRQKPKAKAKAESKTEETQC